MVPTLALSNQGQQIKKVMSHARNLEDTPFEESVPRISGVCMSFTCSYENHVFCFMVYLPTPFLSKMRKNCINVYNLQNDNGIQKWWSLFKGKALFFLFSVAILKWNYTEYVIKNRKWKCTYLRLRKIKSNIFKTRGEYMGNWKFIQLIATNLALLAD